MYAIIGMGEKPYDVEIPCMFFETKLFFARENSPLLQSFFPRHQWGILRKIFTPSPPWHPTKK
jgi:hypothetical protein